MFSKIKKAPIIKPMRVKQARVFSIVGAISVILLLCFIRGNETLGNLGVIGFVVSMFGLGLTGVSRVLHFPTDEFERAKAHKAIFVAYGIFTISVVLFLAAASHVVQLSEFHARDGELKPGYLFEGIFHFYNAVDPSEFWGDLMKLTIGFLIFLPMGILAWLLPTPEIDPLDI